MKFDGHPPLFSLLKKLNALFAVGGGGAAEEASDDPSILPSRELWKTVPDILLFLFRVAESKPETL